MTLDEAFAKLRRSPFRMRFRLSSRDRAYLEAKGLETIRRHAEDFVRERLAQPETYYYFITVNGERVGAIRIVDAKDGGRKRISPLFILPRYWNRGYAQAAMREAEQLHGESGWSLSTIMQEAGNCHLYEKMGYHRTGTPQKINERMTIIQYEKDDPASASETLILDGNIQSTSPLLSACIKSFAVG